MFAIRVLKDGQVKYVRGASMFDTESLVDCPSKAKVFENGNPKTNRELANLLSMINWPTKEFCARSGINVDDYPEIIEFKIKVQVLNSTQYKGFVR